MYKLNLKLLPFLLLPAFVVMGTAAAEPRHDDRRDVRQEDHRGDRHGDSDRHDGGGSANFLKTAVITVTNSGMGPLTITDEPTIRKTSGPGNFAIVPPSTGTRCTTSVVVAPAGSCTIGVQYTSTSHEMSTARLRLEDSGAARESQETELRAN